jgi:tRNA-splicing ligase RtcB (3'-phosphate/5'-hydroxy nucleic acid ligase)
MECQANYFVEGSDPELRVLMNKNLREHKSYTKAIGRLSLARRLKGVISPIIAMPDLCPSFGLPVGSVLATDAKIGHVSLNGIGNDINCGISLSQTNLPINLKSEGFYNHLTRNIKKAIGSQDKVEDIRKILYYGVSGFANRINDSNRIEFNGSVPVVDDTIIDEQMLEIGQKQLGTLGGGNHFVDLLECIEVYDPETALLFGIDQENLLSMIHTGSRGLGSYIRQKASNPNQWTDNFGRIFQPEEYKSLRGKKLIEMNNIASNFGYANRSEMRRKLDKALEDLTNESAQTELIYDFGHNNISVEEINGEELILHRKGVSRAYPAGHQLAVPYYQPTGTPIIIPGSLGTSTYVLVGTPKLSETYFSINHGAGRKFSRGYVRSKKNQPRFQRGFEGVHINLGFNGFCEETPNAYKDIEDVIDTMENGGYVKKVARLKPVYAYLERD